MCFFGVPEVLCTIGSLVSPGIRAQQVDLEPAMEFLLRILHKLQELIHLC